MNKNGVVFSWGKSITRSHSIASELRYEDCHIYPKYSNVLGKFFNYFSAFFNQFGILVKGEYDVVVVVAPPVFSLYSAVAARFFCKNKYKIIFDCHNGVLRKEWRYWPFLVYLARSANVVVSHNNVVKSSIDALYGVNSKILLDPLVPVDDIDFGFVDSHAYIDKEKINILVPVSYASDEPIDDILEAARKLGNNYNLILTGNYNKRFSMVSDLPATFTGYISNSLYFRIMRDVDAVLCLTTNDAIQMCAMIEAVSFGKKAIVTNNSVNNALFSRYIWRFCENDSDSIACAVTNLSDSVSYTASPKLSVDDYKKNWREAAYEIFS